MRKTLAGSPQSAAHQTVRLNLGTKDATSSLRISFTDQRLTAHGGMIVWSHFLHQKRFRHQLREVLPHAPTSPNAYDPTDVALGYVGGILCGADKLSRVAWLQSDPAIAQVLGIEAVASQSTLSRFFEAFSQRTCNGLAGLHRQAVWTLPSLKEGYTLDLDSWALLHEDGHQEGVAVGYTRRGLKPCPRPLIAGLAEAKLMANYWLRSGNSACVNGAAEFLRQTLTTLPKHIRVHLVRGDAGFAGVGQERLASAPVGLGLERAAFFAVLTNPAHRRDAVVEADGDLGRALALVVELNEALANGHRDGFHSRSLPRSPQTRYMIYVNSLGPQLALFKEIGRQEIGP